MDKKYYIISLKHTAKTDNYMTLWRPDNAGYCLSKEMAGVYEDLKEDYHDSDGQLPVECQELEKIMITAPYDGIEKQFVPNCQAVWTVLKVRFIKSELVKI